MIAATLLERGATVALYGADNPASNAELAAMLKAHGDAMVVIPESKNDSGHFLSSMKMLYERFGDLSAIVNLYIPSAAQTEDTLAAYPRKLQEQVVAAGSFMVEKGIEGIVINQFVMSTNFVDHPLAYACAAARGAVTGVTRTACIRFGKAGVRVVGLLVGLLDLPEIREFVSERVSAATTPLGRWITAHDVAGTVEFLALDSGYLTGQMLVLDGGTTSGVNGV
ncbi:SDR family oxidoreductase [Paraburkholderia ribeironis]|uniref:SDR family oxidoreductase n=1 Tax=Paraburkholderia ribeironis TaxID=1247936 RepID=UPI001FEBD109|nr:SDR family oxidoreductase [Paraburkholderia ribeironis]